MPAVEVSRLVVRFGAVEAVRHVSFHAEAGQVTALLGPNGAGKTTTVETLEGYHRPAAGTVRVLGLDPVRDRRHVLPQIGVMLQRGGVYPSMGAAEALALFASYYHRPRDPDELLDRLALRPVARTPWRHLSGGEQQRLSLALALVGRPEVAFLDEPTAGVDPAGRATIRQVVGELRDAGACVLLTTHELAEAEALADRVVIVDRGEVVAEGRPDDLVANATEARFVAPAGLDVAALAAAIGAPVVEDRPGTYRVDAPGDPALVARLTAWLAANDVAVTDLHVGRERLEDVFLRLTSEPR